MASDASFDVVSRVDMAEVTNAVNQASREVETRFDFRGSTTTVELDVKQGQITLQTDSDMRMQSLKDILETKLAKRDVSLRALRYGKVEAAAGNSVRQVVTLHQGIPSEQAKEMTRLIRDSKLKVKAQIQGDELRVSGPKKDDLQAAIALLKQQDFGFDLQFVNYR